MLLDTSGLYCYLDAGDARHQRAKTLLEGESVRVIHSYVIAELIALCNARKVDRRIVLAFVLGLMNDPNVSTVWVGEHESRLALDLLQTRTDKSYSLCDAVSFLLMRQRGLTDALTTDHHFDQEGFARLLDR